jgi:predicted enzyme related to lactoylglutathione lyase/AcrR family transcriptional regulator
VPASRSGRRGRPTQLSRDAVLDAAERLAAERGADTLTMRAVAAELGVSPMALYRHVSDKDGLLVAVLDRQVASLQRPRLPRDPRARLERLFRWLHDGLDERPWVVELLTRGDLMAPSVTWAMEEILRCFVLLGLSERRAVDGYLTAWRYTVGTLVIRHATRRTEATLARAPIQLQALHRVDPSAAPLIAATARYWAAARRDFDYAAGLAALVEGLVSPVALTAAGRGRTVGASRVRVHKIGGRGMEGQLGYWSLNVADTDRAQRFYAAVFGWTYAPPGAHGGVHVEGTAGGFHPAALAVSPAAVLVTDLAQAIGRIRETDGTVDESTVNLDFGYAEAADPAGARFGLVAFGPEYQPPSPAPTGHGQLGYWNLFTADLDVSRAFFADLFGWSYDAPGSAGGLPIRRSSPLGFVTPAEHPDGGLAFFVDDAVVTVETIRAAGGQADDPAASPYGPFAAATDDQGTRFAIWQSNR